RRGEDSSEFSASESDEEEARVRWLGLRARDIIAIEIDIPTGVMSLFVNDELLQMSQPGFILPDKLQKALERKAVHAVMDLGAASSASVQEPRSGKKSVSSISFIPGPMALGVSRQLQIFSDKCGPDGSTSRRFHEFCGTGVSLGNNGLSVRRVHVPEQQVAKNLSTPGAPNRRQTNLGALGRNPVPYWPHLGGIFFECTIDILAEGSKGGTATSSSFFSKERTTAGTADNSCSSEQGFTIGLTSVSPSRLAQPGSACPGQINTADLDPAWGVCIDGRVWHGGISQMKHDLGAVKIDLKPGDRFGLFLATKKTKIAKDSVVNTASDFGTTSRNYFYRGQLFLVLN
ncbi:unnamed protein product, partial [Amoebophrya sp. A25]